SWSFTDASLTPGETTTTITLGTIVDGDAPFVVHLGPVAIVVPFPGVPADSHVVLSSLLDFDELTLGGPGLGTVAINPTIPPLVLDDGYHVRYEITGAFASAGAVTATFKHGTWSVQQTVTPPTT